MNGQIDFSEYLSSRQNELNKKRFQELNIRCCRQELYEFMLAMNRNVCEKFVTIGECHNCSNYSECEYMHKYTLGELTAKAYLN